MDSFATEVNGYKKAEKDSISDVLVTSLVKVKKLLSKFNGF